MLTEGDVFIGVIVLLFSVVFPLWKLGVYWTAAVRLARGLEPGAVFVSARTGEGIAELRRALAQEDDNAVAWRLLAQGYDRRGDDGSARLATAEYNFHVGDRQQARVFAMRARDMLEPGSMEWRRAMDIILASGATMDDLRVLDESTARRPTGVLPPQPVN